MAGPRGLGIRGQRAHTPCLAAHSGTVGDVTMPCLPLLPAWQEGTPGAAATLLWDLRRDLGHVPLEAPKAPLRTRGNLPEVLGSVGLSPHGNWSQVLVLFGGRVSRPGWKAAHPLETLPPGDEGPVDLPSLRLHQ